MEMDRKNGKLLKAAAAGKFQTGLWAGENKTESLQQNLSRLAF